MHTSVRYVSSLSSRIFLGDELCRNKAWLETTSQYTINTMHAVKKLRLFPKFSRRFVHWFLPECRLVRRLLNEARAIIQEVIDKRRAEKIAAAREGRPIPCPNDAIEWAEEESKNDPYDPAVYQIGLSMAAIHTTSDLLNQTLQNLVQRPELIRDLRKEIIEVLQAEGMTKTALFNLKLMDSVLKETQRLKPIKMSEYPRSLFPDVTPLMRLNLNSNHASIGSRGCNPLRWHGNPEGHQVRCTLHEAARPRYIREPGGVRRRPIHAYARHTRKGQQSTSRHYWYRVSGLWPRPPRMPRSVLCCKRAQNRLGPSASQVRLKAHGEFCPHGY